MTIFIARTPYKVTIAPTFLMLKLTLIALLILLAFSSGLSTSKINNWLDKPYNETAAATGTQTDYISIK